MMNIQDFINQFDKPHSVVLLEGKREVSPADTEKLVAIGKILAENTQHIQFRSGNAAGADFYFSQGVASVNGNRLEIMTPYTAHRKTFTVTGNIISLDNIDVPNNAEMIRISKRNEKTKRLIDGYVAGKRDPFSMKAAYILRDTLKVTGMAEILPATVGIFYDDLKHPKAGGTGHTMDVCKQKNVPVITQTVWFNWLQSKN